MGLTGTPTSETVEENKIVIRTRSLASTTIVVDGEEVDAQISTGGGGVIVDFEDDDIEDGILFSYEDLIRDAIEFAYEDGDE